MSAGPIIKHGGRSGRPRRSGSATIRPHFCPQPVATWPDPVPALTVLRSRPRSSTSAMMVAVSPVKARAARSLRRGALPGEVVMAEQTARSRHFDEARTLEVLQASPQRVTPSAPFRHLRRLRAAAPGRRPADRGQARADGQPGADRPCEAGHRARAAGRRELGYRRAVSRCAGSKRRTRPWSASVNRIRASLPTSASA